MLNDLFFFLIEAIQNEINSHAVVIKKLIENGLEMVRTRPLQTDAARTACGNLKDRFHFLQQASDARKEALQLSCDAFQVYSHLFAIRKGFFWIPLVLCFLSCFSTSPCKHLRLLTALFAIFDSTDSPTVV